MATGVLIAKRPRKELKIITRVISQERYEYKDPVTEFVYQLFVRYDFAAAAKANAMVGGDNASRAVAIGMVLGAYHGVNGIPKPLRDGLNAWKKCDALLDKLPLLSKAGKSEL